MNNYCGDNFECLKNHEKREISYGSKIERYEHQVNTSSLYKTFNLPERFENTRKHYTPILMDYSVASNFHIISNDILFF